MTREQREMLVCAVTCAVGFFVCSSLAVFALWFISIISGITPHNMLLFIAAASGGVFGIGMACEFEKSGSSNIVDASNE